MLNEIAAAAGVGVRIEETRIPVRTEVAGLCEILGLDPLYLANEGTAVAIVPPNEAEAALAAWQAHPYGAQACVIGAVTSGPRNRVTLCTSFGGERLVDLLAGDQLPRIC